jgi:hypothetical protein
MRLTRRAMVAVLAIAGVVSGASAASARPAPPEISKLSQSSDVAGGGATIAVSGSGFVHVVKVLFGSKRGTRIKTTSRTRLTVHVPKHAPGTVDVRVVVKSGATTTISAKRKADRFTYFGRPTITKLSPSSGSITGGRTVTVTGNGFRRITKVMFGPNPGTQLRVTSTHRLTVTAPKHAAGTVTVVVRSAYGTSAPRTAARYAYLSASAMHWGSTEQITASALLSVSCPVTSFCAAVDADGHALVSKNYIWSATSLNTNGALTSVSCPSTTFCMATNVNGSMWKWNGSSWSSARAAPAHGQQARSTVSCVSSTFCVWAGDAAGVSVFDGSWSRRVMAGDDWTSVSCKSASFCAAVSGQGKAAIYHGSGSWSPLTTVATGSLPTVSCASSSFCMTFAAKTGQSYEFTGAKWFHETVNSENGTTAVPTVSCSSSTFCAAVDASSRSLTFDGKRWSAATKFSLPGPRALSCASSQCVAVGATGNDNTGTA